MTGTPAAAGQPPVVLVTGSDRYEVMERFHTQRERLQAVLAPALGVDDFEGEDVAVAAQAVDAARTPPMFGGCRLVVLRHCVNEATLPLLTAYAGKPSEDSTMLLVHVRSGTAAKGYADFVKVVKATGEVDEVKALPDRSRDLAAFITRRAHDNNLTLRSDAAGYLAAHLGSDAGAIGGVLDQLAAAFADKPVDAKMAALFVAGPKTARTWDLTDSIDAGDTAAALLRLRSILGEMHPLQVQVVLAGHVRRTLHAMELRPRTPSELEDALGLKPFPAKKMFGKLRMLRRPDVYAAVSAVAEADTALRGASGLSGPAVLEVLVARLSGLLGQT